MSVPSSGIILHLGSGRLNVSQHCILSMPSSPPKDRYSGSWRDGKMHGKGVLECANGDRYEGEFQDHMRHGQAVFLPGGDFKGDRFEGEYRNDEMYKGVYYDSKRNQERRIEPKKSLLKSYLIELSKLLKGLHWVQIHKCPMK